MYAIISDGSNQYKVEEGQELTVDYRDASSGDELKFENVLAVSSDSGLQLLRHGSSDARHLLTQG